MRPLILVIGLFLVVLGFATAYYPLIVAGSCGSGCTTVATVGNLVGYVTNESSGSGIVGASVKLLVSGAVKYAVSTTTAGYYKFSAITAGGYVISLSAGGYQSLQASTGVSPGTTATFNAALSPVASPAPSSGSGCTPLPTGGCSVPPPPPGVSPPPPLPPGGNVTGNNTNPTNPNNPPTQPYVPPGGAIGVVESSPISIFLVVAGIVVAGAGAFSRRGP